jgi:hypothetical protein
MLIFAGIEFDCTEKGQRPMLCFCPPNSPGVHYRVETDAETAERLRVIFHSEASRMADVDDEGSSDGCRR